MQQCFYRFCPSRIALYTRLTPTHELTLSERSAFLPSRSISNSALFKSHVGTVKKTSQSYNGGASSDERQSVPTVNTNQAVSKPQYEEIGPVASTSKVTLDADNASSEQTSEAIKFLRSARSLNIKVKRHLLNDLLPTLVSVPITSDVVDTLSLYSQLCKECLRPVLEAVYRDHSAKKVATAVSCITFDFHKSVKSAKILIELVNHMKFLSSIGCKITLAPDILSSCLKTWLRDLSLMSSNDMSFLLLQTTEYHYKAYVKNLPSRLLSLQDGKVWRQELATFISTMQAPDSGSSIQTDIVALIRHYISLQKPTYALELMHPLLSAMPVVEMADKVDLVKLLEVLAKSSTTLSLDEKLDVCLSILQMVASSPFHIATALVKSGDTMSDSLQSKTRSFFSRTDNIACRIMNIFLRGQSTSQQAFTKDQLDRLCDFAISQQWPELASILFEQSSATNKLKTVDLLSSETFRLDQIMALFIKSKKPSKAIALEKNWNGWRPPRIWARLIQASTYLDEDAQIKTGHLKSLLREMKNSDVDSQVVVSLAHAFRHDWDNLMLLQDMVIASPSELSQDSLFSARIQEAMLDAALVALEERSQPGLAMSEIQDFFSYFESDVHSKDIHRWSRLATIQADPELAFTISSKLFNSPLSDTFLEREQTRLNAVLIRCVSVMLARGRTDLALDILLLPTLPVQSVLSRRILKRVMFSCIKHHGIWEGGFGLLRVLQLLQRLSVSEQERLLDSNAVVYHMVKIAYGTNHLEGIARVRELWSMARHSLRAELFDKCLRAVGIH